MFAANSRDPEAGFNNASLPIRRLTRVPPPLSKSSVNGPQHARRFNMSGMSYRTKRGAVFNYGWTTLESLECRGHPFTEATPDSGDREATP